MKQIAINVLYKTKHEVFNAYGQLYIMTNHKSVPYRFLDAVNYKIDDIDYGMHYSHFTINGKLYDSTFTNYLPEQSKLISIFDLMNE